TGYVIARNILLGQHAKAGMDLYKIADLSRIWFFADVYESELANIQTGQQAKLTLPYNPEMALAGKIDYIYPSIDRETRTAKIRLIFPNPDFRLKPGMYANVEIAIDLSEQLVVPQTAVLNTGRRQLVFVDHGNGRFEPREIKTGSKVERYYTILAGLKTGEVVVKSGNFLIDAEAHVQGVLQTMEK
ncbi:MAG: efflux RND transporter periplasmic adaptor subunit, partial [bacterium]